MRLFWLKNVYLGRRSRWQMFVEQLLKHHREKQIYQLLNAESVQNHLHKSCSTMQNVKKDRMKFLFYGNHRIR